LGSGGGGQVLDSLSYPVSGEVMGHVTKAGQIDELGVGHERAEPSTMPSIADDEVSIATENFDGCGAGRRPRDKRP
jgi:hypothetical protein